MDTNGMRVVVQESPHGEDAMEASAGSTSEEGIPQQETVVNILPSSEPSSPGKTISTSTSGR